MEQKEFNVVVEETIQAIRKLLIVKGGEYAGSEDRLANFKRGAQLTGIEPMTVALIYLSKHYDGVCTYIRDLQTGQDRPRSESIEGRLDDMINYCILIKAIIKERRAHPVAGSYRPFTVDEEDEFRKTGEVPRR